MSASQEVFPPVGSPILKLDQFLGGSLLTWTPVPNATHYDVVCGGLQQLRSSGGNFTSATGTCLQDNQPSTSTAESSVPAPGQGLWCVVRGGNIAGLGSYEEGGSQIGTRGGEILASGLGCP